MHELPPKPHIAKGAAYGSLEAYQAAYERSLQDPEGFWAEQAERLDWFKKWDRVKSGGFKNLDFKWFEGGKLNVCTNCVDRHAAADPERTAIIWAGDEPGTYRHISYGELAANVCRMANVLIDLGVSKGDRVAIYLPMIPELAYAMLACARLGAIHSVVFAGFSAGALKSRIQDAECRLVITANQGLRGGRAIPLKNIVDKALTDTPCVKNVLVARHTQAETPMTPGRDQWLEDAMNAAQTVAPVEEMDAEDPLFILYTSGSTGRPKGVLHTTGGYLTYASFTHDVVFDLHPGDVYACVADIGWITGHSYIVYGPLANGATTVMFESTPTYPDAGRYWRMVEDLGITIFYTAPTALRAIAQAGDEHVQRYDRSSLRILGSVGEPINPEIWWWYHNVVGEKRCAVVDTWWQTETGGIMISPLPGATPTKPGSATFPLFGVQPMLRDPENRLELTGNGVSGALCLTDSWPGQARTIYKDHQRFRDTYFSTFPGLYFTGDGCTRDADGYYWITGRIDDVLNVSGHLLGTAEVESALVAHAAVAEAAVVGFPHDIKGVGILAFVTLVDHAQHLDTDVLKQELRNLVGDTVGPIAKPDKIQFAPGLPKTRSGKIMRRILRKLAEGVYTGLGDVTTLADPDVVQRLIEDHKRENA